MYVVFMILDRQFVFSKALTKTQGTHKHKKNLRLLRCQPIPFKHISRHQFTTIFIIYAFSIQRANSPYSNITRGSTVQHSMHCQTISSALQQFTRRTNIVWQRLYKVEAKRIIMFALITYRCTEIKMNTFQNNLYASSIITINKAVKNIKDSCLCFISRALWHLKKNDRIMGRKTTVKKYSI